jgi:DNA excision repair protein ERCC-2
LDYPYELREYQRDTIEFIKKSLSNYDSVIIEAPTGSGKTIMSLLGAIEYKEGTSRKILYLTRTNSQQEQVINELRKLKGNLRMKAIPFQGRGNLCLLYREIENSEEFSPESLSKFCSLRKKKVMEGNNSACRFFNHNVRSRETKNYILNEIPSAEEIYYYGVENVICPYESIKAALPDADIVIAPYAYFLNFGAGERFLNQWGVSRDQLIIILDEAHNLPDISRSVSSFDISVDEIDRAEKEAVEFGDEELMPRTRSSDFLDVLRSALLSLKRDYIGEEDEGRISFDTFREYVMIAGSMNSEKFQSLNAYLNIFGDRIISIKEERMRVPRSSVYTLSGKIAAWEEIDSERYIALVSNRRTASVEAYCLDPSVNLSPLKMSKTIHISGTLEPHSTYINLTGFTGARFLKINEVFPRENRFILYSDEITTKFDQFDNIQLELMVNMINELIEKSRRRTIVFFPSYQLMDKVFSHSFSFEVIKEERAAPQNRIMETVDSFREGKGVLFAVSGGRISEGMNFPGGELEMVIVAGIPYPRPDARNKALMDFYQRYYGNGWEYAVTFPALIKLRQEIGRLIRNENDVGAAVILDKRASNFRKYIPDLKMSRNPVGDVIAFFESKKEGGAITNF